MKYFALFAAAAFAFALPAAAQDNFEPERLGGFEKGEDKPAPRSNGVRVIIPAGLLYASFDTNANYAVDAGELAAGTQRSFKAADKNASGSLSLVELATWRERVLGSRDLLPGNTQFDKNFDSRIDNAEFEMVLSDIFRGSDKDKNGLLEFGEMTRAVQPRGEARERSREGTAQFPQRSQRRRPGYPEY